MIVTVLKRHDVGLNTSRRSRVARVLREPLLHFLLIGLALFLYYGHVAPRDSDNRRIVVSQAQVEDLARQFQATWSRPPSPQELSSLVDSYIHDEILYREGESLGLGRDDVVIKRRIRQKLDVMAEEEIARDAPTDAELEAYLKAHPSAFERPATLSFEQILFAATGSDADVDRALRSARGALAHGARPDKLGQPTMLPEHVEDVALDQVARDFGEQFAKQLGTMPLKEWTGPVASSFGLHLVRINARKAADLPALEAVRPQVLREWENEQRKRALDASYRKLRQNYKVEIDAKLPEAPKS